MLRSKIFLLFIAPLLFIYCNEKKQSYAKSEIGITTTKKNYESKIKYIKNFAKEYNYNKDIAFMVDYSLHSGLYRFFVVDLKKDSIIKKGLVCHGSCKGEDSNDENADNFSNTPESLCTSLGMALIAERDYSQWGKNYKYWLDGLETSNSNMRKRVVVLHAWDDVSYEEIYPNALVMSWGCPTVSLQFLDELDIILKKHKKVLLYSFE